jgi:hypothetical protein
MGRRTFPPTLREDDFPSIGQSRGGYTLVCHGDDRPTEFVGWLAEFASTFEELNNLAEQHSVRFTAPQGRRAPTSLVDFCEAIGIDMDSSPWQGQMISGSYWLGWLRGGTLRTTKSRARSLLASMSKQIESSVRAAVMRKLSAIRDLDTFLDRTAPDRRELRKEIETLKESIQQLLENAQQTALATQHRLNEDTHEIDQACLDIACAILLKRPTRLVAGPLLLWDDGVVYAIVSRGGVPIPTNSSARKLIDALVAANHPVVQVREKTVIGGWTSGPIYRKGDTSIKGWASIWRDQERSPRRFEGEQPGDAERAYELHLQLVSAGTRQLDP